MPFSLDIRFVKRAEEKLGRRLPPDYVTRMCFDNGGEVQIDSETWSLYPILDDGDRKRLKRACNDIIYETTAAHDWATFPPNALAIGDNGGGDKLVFLADPVADRYADVVYLWDHETGELSEVAPAVGALFPVPRAI